MIRVVDDRFSKEDWNKIAPHPMQSWEWGETRKKTGTEVLRIGEFKGDKLTSGFQLTVHRVPRSKYKIAYLPRSAWPSYEVLEFLQKWGKSNNIVFIKMEPYIEKSQFPISNFQSNLKAQILKSKHQLFPDWTIVLNLDRSEDELLKNMRQKTRYNIRLAEKKGVTVHEMTNEEGFGVFWKLYSGTMKRQNYFGHNYDYHKTIFNNLKNKMAHIFIAFYQMQPLAAYELFVFNNRAYYPYGGSSLEHKNIMAPNLLMWEAIKFARNKGCKYFDMWGSSSPDAPANDLYAGFTRFKEGYGGKFVEMAGSYDLVINPLLYKVYNLGYKLRSYYLNLSSFR